MPASRWLFAALCLALPAAVSGQTFGRVVALGGHSADLALDEPRQLLYVANFTANRIDVIATETGALDRSINVPSQPSSLALSPDGRYLVVGHYGNFAAPGTPMNALSVIELDSRARRTFSLPDPPFGVAFGADGRALIVTSAQFLLFDPVLETIQVVDTISGLTARTLPAPPANFPAQIIGASVQASGDGLKVFGVTDTILFSYDVLQRRVHSGGYVAEPPLGPRAISTAKDGSYYLAGWGMFDNRGLLNQFPNPAGLLSIGSHAIDSDRGIVYAQVTEGAPPAQGSPQSPAGQPNQSLPAPVLAVADADNLAVRQKIRLPENLSGKGILSSDGSVMYALSESGVTILPVGHLDQAPRIVAEKEDLVFRSNFCNPGALSQDLAILDPGGGRTDFSLSATAAGIRLSTETGVTPATVRVTVDPGAFQNARGTFTAYINIKSKSAVNQIQPVRVLINLQNPDQRGSTVNVPGKLVDIAADPFRNRFFILRQDRNQVLVYDASSYQQLATLRTGNTPTSMSLTFDRRYLLVGNDNSQYANVYDLETLQPEVPIRFPFGHYPRSLASSARGILAATRVAGPEHKIDQVDFFMRTAYELPTLGIFKNSIHVNTALAASPNGSSILAAQADGNVLLYSANADTFTVSRKDFPSLSGAIAVSNFDQYVIGSALLNASLVPVQQFDNSIGRSSGFLFLDQSGYRTGAADPSSPGLIQKLNLDDGTAAPASRMSEAPVLGSSDSVFTRTLAVLADRSYLVSLTNSGFTLLPYQYGAAVAAPRIERVVNAADRSKAVAPGGLIVIEGQNLSAVSLATSEMPLPVALGQTCLTVNGMPVPMLMVSSNRINAQLPFQAEGNVTIVLRTPGGIGDDFPLTVLPAAPSIFLTQLTEDYSASMVVREANSQVVTPANPIRSNDALRIYLTGMGKTKPEIPAGVPAPRDPPSVLIEPLVDIAGFRLPVDFSALVPGQVGVYEIRVYVPHTVPKGMSLPLRIQQGSYSSIVEVRVID